MFIFHSLLPNLCMHIYMQTDRQTDRQTYMRTGNLFGKNLQLKVSANFRLKSHLDHGSKERIL